MESKFFLLLLMFVVVPSIAIANAQPESDCGPKNGKQEAATKNASSSPGLMKRVLTGVLVASSLVAGAAGGFGPGAVGKVESPVEPVGNYATPAHILPPPPHHYAPSPPAQFHYGPIVTAQNGEGGGQRRLLQSVSGNILHLQREIAQLKQHASRLRKEIQHEKDPHTRESLQRTLKIIQRQISQKERQLKHFHDADRDAGNRFDGGGGRRLLQGSSVSVNLQELQAEINRLKQRADEVSAQIQQESDPQTRESMQQTLQNIQRQISQKESQLESFQEADRDAGNRFGGGGRRLLQSFSVNFPELQAEINQLKQRADEVSAQIQQESDPQTRESMQQTLQHIQRQISQKESQLESFQEAEQDAENRFRDVGNRFGGGGR